MDLKSLLTTGFLLFAFFVRGQAECEMRLVGNKLVATCEEGGLFESFQIALEKPYANLNTEGLLKLLPKKGSGTILTKKKYDADFVITERSGFKQVLFKARLGWYTFDDLKFENGKFYFTVDHDADVPFTREDLEVLKEARKLLKDDLHWNKEDERICDDDLSSGKYSLFCAIKTAYIKVHSEWNHRNAIFQKIRHLIGEKHAEKIKHHRLLEYNNMHDTSFESIMDLLDQIEILIVEQLESNR